MAKLGRLSAPMSQPTLRTDNCYSFDEGSFLGPTTIGDPKKLFMNLTSTGNFPNNWGVRGGGAIFEYRP